MVAEIKSILTLFADGKSPAFSAAGQAMGELFAAGCIGSACVQSNSLTPTMVQNLSKTAFSVLIPMFYFTSIMKTVQKFGFTSRQLVVPLLAMTHIMTLFFVTKVVLMPIFGMRDNSDDNRATLFSCGFGNTMTIPMILCEAIFRNHDPSTLVRAYSQISLFMLGEIPIFWSFGRNFLVGDYDSPKNVRLVNFKTIFATIKKLCPPPLVGNLSGLFIALVLPLRNVFMNTPDHKAPLNVVFKSIEKFGQAANPSSLLVLTASLALGTSSTSTLTTDSVSLDDGGEVNFMRRYLCVSIARFIISPLLMYFMLQTLHKLGIMESSKTAPMVWFILLLQSCMPSAQNTVLMLQVADKGGAASRLAKFLFSIYASSMVPLVFVSTILLDKFQIMT